MALLKVRKRSGFIAPTEGWHEVTIVSADRGMYSMGNKGKYLDIRFEEFPEQVKMRVHQMFDDKTNEEWKILGLFKEANAGITEILATEDGGEAQMNIDDDPRNLVGAKLNVYVYRNAKGYTDVSDRVCPVPFTNDWDSYSEKDVEGIKMTLEAKIKSYVAKQRPAQDDWSSSSDNGAPEETSEVPSTPAGWE